jgi:hypothetical protein
MPGKKMRSIKGGAAGRRRYEALRRSGLSKSSSAAITNAGATKAGRVRMARKAARTRAKQGT